MKRFIPILILTVSLVVAACAPAPKESSTPSDPIDVSRTDSLGGVTIKITPLNLNQPGDTLKFDIAMDTHSVELGMDLATLASLSTDTGLTIQPKLWDAPLGGHHIEGTLSFPTTQDGKSVLDGAKQLSLTISNVDDATRTFTWDLSTK